MIIKRNAPPASPYNNVVVNINNTTCAVQKSTLYKGGGGKGWEKSRN